MRRARGGASLDINYRITISRSLRLDTGGHCNTELSFWNKILNKSVIRSKLKRPGVLGPSFPVE